MSDAVFVFAAGITGVFIGMSCLYLTMKAVSFLITRREAGAEEP
jgi:hypothetical protein